MVNLLEDTLKALAYYQCDMDSVEGMIYYNEDKGQLEGITWQDFTKLAKDINYDPYDFEFIGRRWFKSRIFIIGDQWFMARTLSEHHFEGWLYYDDPLMIRSNGQPITLESGIVPVTKPDDDLLAFMISDLRFHYSDYTSDEAYKNNVYRGNFRPSQDSTGICQVGIVHGINGRRYWSGSNTHTAHPQLLYNENIVGMVLSGDYKDITLFNNDTLSRIIGVEDAGYINEQDGDLTVTYIPPQHFTIGMDVSDNEVIHLTKEAPYYNSL